MKTNDAISVLSALAQDTRMRVFRLLVKFGSNGLPAGKIAETLSVNGTTLSRHLAQMEQVGLLTSRRDARQVIYAPNFAAMQDLMAFLMQDLMAFLMEDCCAGELQLAQPHTQQEHAGRSCCDSEGEKK
nr:metalloregulator ArsR/SmtB family transcription factor [Kordiimonas aestuarii]